MSNEELVALIQAGDRDKLVQLWGQVKRLVWKQANRWAAYGNGGVTVEDLMQAGFVAVLLAASTFDSTKGTKFSTHLFPRLRAEFTAATGWSTRQGQLDPLQSALSLDAPMTDDDDSLTLADTIEDPTAATEIESTDIRLAVSAALSELPEEQQKVIRDKYWCDLPVDARTHAAAMKRLRHPDCSRRLKAYL